MRTLAVKTLELNRKIEILSHRSTQDRLMAYLHSVAQQKGTSEFDIPFERQQLADFCRHILPATCAVTDTRSDAFSTPT